MHEFIFKHIFPVRVEIDSDGSGTVDFDEFMEVMTGEDSTSAFKLRLYHFCFITGGDD